MVAIARKTRNPYNLGDMIFCISMMYLCSEHLLIYRVYSIHLVSSPLRFLGIDSKINDARRKRQIEELLFESGSNSKLDDLRQTLFTRKARSCSASNQHMANVSSTSAQRAHAEINIIQIHMNI